MRWDRFFEDLEDQLDSEWEAERAVLDTEAERLRLSRLSLRERLAALAAAGGPPIVVDLLGGARASGGVHQVGADWCALDPGSRRAGPVIVPLSAIGALHLRAPDLLSSARGERLSRIAERMTLGFVLRDLARRRLPVTVESGTSAVSGTIDRAAADHLDLAEHERGEPRSPGEVRSYRIIPLAAVTLVRVDAPAALS